MSKEIKKAGGVKILKHYKPLSKLTPIEQKAVIGWKNPIKSLEISPRAKKIKIGAVILNNIKLLGGAFGTDEVERQLIIDACVNSIMNNFSHYGFEDIDAAFELWSLGKIGNKSTEMYSGLFNVMILNRILNEYESHRKIIVNNYVGSQKSEYEIADEKRKEYGKSEIKKLKDSEIINLIKKYKNYLEIPWYCCTLAFKRKLIELSQEEIEDYKKRAKVLAKAQVISENNENIALGLIGKSTKELEKNILDRNKVTAVKLSVFEKLGNGNN